MTRKGFPGLTAQIKDKLIQQALERRLRQAEHGSSVALLAHPSAGESIFRSSTTAFATTLATSKFASSTMVLHGWESAVLFSNCMKESPAQSRTSGDGSTSTTPATTTWVCPATKWLQALPKRPLTITAPRFPQVGWCPGKGPFIGSSSKKSPRPTGSTTLSFL